MQKKNFLCFGLGTYQEKLAKSSKEYLNNNIVIEYKKHCDKFVKTINYFLECTNNITDLIETSNLLKFFLNLKLKDKSEN